MSNLNTYTDLHNYDGNFDYQETPEVQEEATPEIIEQPSEVAPQVQEDAEVVAQPVVEEVGFITSLQNAFYSIVDSCSHYINNLASNYTSTSSHSLELHQDQSQDSGDTSAE